MMFQDEIESLVGILFYVGLGMVILLFLQYNGFCIIRTRGSEPRKPKSKKNASESTPQFNIPEDSSSDTEESNTEENETVPLTKITYNKKDVLGKGNSKVYSGLFEGEIKVAVKRVKHNDSEKVNECLDKFEKKWREIKINQELKKLGHINVAIYYGYETRRCKSNTGRERYVTLIAIEKCDRTLKRVIEERDEYSDLTNHSIFNQTANGLQFLHSRSIVHRDLKPSNILLRIDEKANPRKFILKLSDFGVSKLLPTDSSYGTLSSTVGTVNWMAPEISSCKSFDLDKLPFKKCDVYSLGLVFLCIEVKEDHFRGNDFDDHLNSLENYTLRKLIEEGMCNEDPNKRMKTTQLLKHPALWDAEYTLTFFEKASDASKDKFLKLPDLEKESLDTFPISDTRIGWKNDLTSEVASHLSSPKNCRVRYRFDCVYSLLRAIRNCSHHYRELPLSVQIEFGSYPKEFISYWTSRFPKLLLHVYNVMQNEVKNFQDDDLQKYY